MEITEKEVLNKWIEYTLTNDNGIQVSLLNYGGILTKLVVPDREGKLENIVLGYQNFEDYEQDSNYFGAIIGRVAGRIENASFELDGKTYQLKTNEGNHHLHGGESAFHQVIWDAMSFQNDDEAGVKLSHTGSDDAGGYPGRADVTVTYTLNNKNELLLDYEATTTEKTILTLTNHTYFNLTGNLKDTIENHQVSMNSEQFLELDEALIPTGNCLDVAGTPFDFREGNRLAAGMHSSHQQNTIAGGGYDHYFLFNENEVPHISISEPTSGRMLDITTNQPGVVMYTSNSLDKALQLSDGNSRKHAGVCFETQASPASLKYHQLPSIILGANDTYKKQTCFTFHSK
ncbi:aldose epimerase family protein [Oceanobacillus sp. FSL H7-0719]|uniref:aldose epimerase family protein n=1 Tax=Oceanobacillus sp. FSL H7-0719 TaxID=2954507 RepID=UPI00324DC95B